MPAPKIVCNYPVRPNVGEYWHIRVGGNDHDVIVVAAPRHSEHAAVRILTDRGTEEFNHTVHLAAFWNPPACRYDHRPLPKPAGLLRRVLRRVLLGRDVGPCLDDR